MANGFAGDEPMPAWSEIAPCVIVSVPSSTNVGPALAFAHDDTSARAGTAARSGAMSEAAARIRRSTAGAYHEAGSAQSAPDARSGGARAGSVFRGSGSDP